MRKVGMISISISIFMIGALNIFGSAFAHSEGSPREMRVTGEVSFERRATIVPFRLCESEPCARSTVYWSVIVHSQGVDYELDQTFNSGEENPPEAIELQGVVLRPGTRVAMDGKVELVARGYAILMDLKKVDIVMDYVLLGGWNCSTPDLVGTTKLWVDVWFQNEIQSGPTHQMRISGEQNRVRSVWARLGASQLKDDEKFLAYKGVSLSLSAELEIHKRSKKAGKFQAKLVLQDLTSDEANQAPLTSVYRLECSPMR